MDTDIQSAANPVTDYEDTEDEKQTRIANATLEVLAIIAQELRNLNTLLAPKPADNSDAEWKANPKILMKR